MLKVLVFAGTTEGKALALAMEKTAAKRKDVDFFVSVATNYGRELLPENRPGFTVVCGRLDKDQIVDLIRREEIEAIVDCTHPYAKIVSENILAGAEEVGIPRYRVTRELVDQSSKYVYVDSMAEAADYLEATQGNVLLTTGSKELAAFTRVTDFEKRLYPRMLPFPEGIEAVLSMGYRKQNLICMQGPFNVETNYGMMKQIGARYLVTKESGRAGGFQEKLEGADKAGVTVIIVGRPAEEDTVTLEEICSKWNIEPVDNDSGNREFYQENKLGGTIDKFNPNSSRFPLYINLEDKKVVIVGGGKIALRRGTVLKDFMCNVKVIAKEITSDQYSLDGLDVNLREFRPEDIEGAYLVVAATDDHQLNEEIGRLCNNSHILVNVASNKDQCDFYFPGIVRSGDVTVGVIAGGKNHKLAATIREKIERLLNEEDC